MCDFLKKYDDKYNALGVNHCDHCLLFLKVIYFAIACYPLIAGQYHSPFSPLDNILGNYYSTTCVYVLA